MKRKMENGLITAATLILVGALFIIFKGEVVSIAMSIIGLALVILGVVDALKKYVVSGVIKIALGALVLMAGWLFISLALYVLGAFLLIAGVSELYAFTKLKIKRLSLPVALRIAQPVIYILVAICLFFNQGGAISWVFTVSGIFLVLDGTVALIGALDK